MTPAAYAGRAWRLAEDQGRPATMRLVDTLEEQARLEALLEARKPPLPPGCAHLHYLLATPFRYPPSRHGSRFRRAHAAHGCFYAAEHVETAAIETAFWQLLLFCDAPALALPGRPVERLGFRVALRTEAALDLTAPPWDAERARWTHPTDYAPCQDLAERAVAAGVQLLRSASVRDPEGRANLAVLAGAAFARRAPEQRQGWWVFLRPRVLQAWCDAPRIRIELPYAAFAADPRIAAWLAARPS